MSAVAARVTTLISSVTMASIASFPSRTAVRLGFWIRMVWTVSQPYSLAVLSPPRIIMIAAPIVDENASTFGMRFSGNTSRFRIRAGTWLRKLGGGFDSNT